MYYILEKTDGNKFPYRISIKKSDKTLFCLRVQDKRPWQKWNIFCIREREDSKDVFEKIEEVPVVSFNRFGKKVSLVLDRSINKRCDFLFLKKKYKNKEWEYEQIFWSTPQWLRQNKPKYKLSTYHKWNLDIIIDSNERYPRSFPNCNTKKVKLTAWDYALENNWEIIAVIERKTFENMLWEFTKLQLFHQQLSELTSYKNSALVIEANYSDFMNPNKFKYYKPAFLAKAIWEISAFHPNLMLIFAGNRKFANEFAFNFFEAVNSNIKDKIPNRLEFADNVETKYNKNSSIYFKIKFEINKNFVWKSFYVKEIKDIFSDFSDSSIRQNLEKLLQHWILQKFKEKNKTYYKLV